MLYHSVHLYWFDAFIFLPPTFLLSSLTILRASLHLSPLSLSLSVSLSLTLSISPSPVLYASLCDVHLVDFPPAAPPGAPPGVL